MLNTQSCSGWPYYSDALGVGEDQIQEAGDSLAAAITAELAKGNDLHTAVTTAKEFVTHGIEQSFSAGTPFGVVWQG